MKQRIENKMNDYIESLLAKAYLTCDEYLVLKKLYKDILTEEQTMRVAEARAQKINNMLNAKEKNNEL